MKVEIPEEIKRYVATNMNEKPAHIAKMFGVEPLPVIRYQQKLKSQARYLETTCPITGWRSDRL